MPTLSERYATHKELGQYTKSLPKGAKLHLTTKDGGKVYEYKGVYLKPRQAYFGGFEAYSPMSSMSKDLDDPTRPGHSKYAGANWEGTPTAAQKAAQEKPAAAAKPAAKPAVSPPQAAPPQAPAQAAAEAPAAASPAQSLTDLAAQGAQGTTGAAGAAGPTGATASPEKGGGFLGQSLGGGVPPSLLPTMLTAPGSPGINDAGRQNLLLQHLLQSLQQRQSRDLYGAMPGSTWNTQGQELGRPSPDEQLAAAGGGNNPGGWGIIKEPGVLGQLLAMADASAKERQAATEKQYELAEMPLDVLRKYVDSDIPQQASKLLANYAGLTGEMKTLLEDNLTKLSQEGGRIGNVARAALKNDLSSLSKELNVPKKDIEGYVASASKDYRQAITDAGGMAATAGTRAAGDIRAAAAEAAGGVLPGQEARAEELAKGYKAESVQEILAQSESKDEALDIVRDLYGGRKQDIIRSFDEQIAKAEGASMQDAMSRGLDRTTAKMVASGEVNRLKAQKQSALNQVSDMTAQAKLQATNMWNQGKAAARQMFSTGRLGAEQATGAQIGQMAAGFAGAGQQGLTQAGITGLTGEQARGGQLAQGLAGIGQAGLGALTDLTRQKMSGITQGYGGLMNLIQSMAGQEFGAQAGGRQQMTNLLSNIGLQERSAEQRGTEFQGMREQDLGFKRSDFEAAVQHVGTLDPAQLIDLAKGLGMYSQLGPPMAGNIGAGGEVPAPIMPPMPGQPQPQPQPKPPEGNVLRDIINKIDINLGDIIGGAGNLWPAFTSPTGTAISQITGLPGLPQVSAGGSMITMLWEIIKNDPQQALKFLNDYPGWFHDYFGMTPEEYEVLPPERQQELINEKAKPPEPVPDDKTKPPGGHAAVDQNDTAQMLAEAARQEAGVLPPGIMGQVVQPLGGQQGQGIVAQQQPAPAAALTPNDILAQINAGNREGASNLINQINHQVSNRLDQNGDGQINAQDLSLATNQGNQDLISKINNSITGTWPNRVAAGLPVPNQQPATSVTGLGQQGAQQKQSATNLAEIARLEAMGNAQLARPAANTVSNISSPRPAAQKAQLWQTGSKFYRA